jgi:hypothetical protein
VVLPANFTSQQQPLDLTIIEAFKCSYGKQFIRRLAMIDGSRLLQDAAHVKLDLTLVKQYIGDVWRYWDGLA